MKYRKSKIKLSSNIENLIVVFFLALLFLGVVALFSSLGGVELPWLQEEIDSEDIPLVDKMPSDKEEETPPGTDNMENGGQNGVDRNDSEDNMDPDGWTEVNPDETSIDDIYDTPFADLTW